MPFTLNTPPMQRRFFITLLVLVTIAFLAVLFPFYSAVFWALVLAMLFAPLQRAVRRRIPTRPNTAALITLSVILFLVLLPISMVVAAMVREATAVYGRIASGEIDFAHYLERIVSLLPEWIRSRMADLDLLDLAGLQERLRDSAAALGQALAPQAINIGQNTLQFLVSLGVMLYLLYFLLRDGPWLAASVSRAIPLAEEQKGHLLRKFVTVIKATVKGNIAVAAAQGALGGLILWLLGIQGVLLWSVVMAFLSLLPAVGAALIWGPIALYFLATGAIWQGVVLIAYGIFVIGLVDNVLRPILVGKDTKLPDWLVLITTLGGLAVFGLNGFVIGPMIAALFVAAWDLFTSPEKVHAEERREALEDAAEEAAEEAADEATRQAALQEARQEAAADALQLDPPARGAADA